MAVIRCVKCGRVVSNEFPDHIKLGLMAFVECHHCVNAEVFSERVVFQQITPFQVNIKIFELFMKCKFKGIDMNEIKDVITKQFDKALKCKFTKEGYYNMLESGSEKMDIMNKQQKKKVG